MQQCQSRRECCDERCASRNCGRIAIERDHTAIGRFENGTRVPTRTECAVNVGFAGPRLQCVQHVGSITGMWRAMSGEPEAAVMNPLRRRRLIGAAAVREAAMLLDFFAGHTAAFVEPLRRPTFETCRQADESDFGLKTGVAAKRLRKDDAPVAVDRENLDVTVERDREFVTLVE